MDVYWYLVPRDGFYPWSDEKIIPTVPDVANFVYRVG
jgi:hypothetical protein